MAKKERYPDGFYSPYIGAARESEGSGSLGHSDTEMTASEDSIAPIRKCINLNSGHFGVPFQVHPLSKMSMHEKKDLVCRLRAELEQIRYFQKKVASNRTSAAALSLSNDIRNAQNSPFMVSSQTANMGTGPGKMPLGSNRGSADKFESAEQVSAPTNPNAVTMKQCMTLLRRLLNHEYAWVFKEPVDVVKLNLPDYFTIIKHPMDLGIVKKKLASKAYTSPWNLLLMSGLPFPMR